MNALGTIRFFGGMTGMTRKKSSDRLFWFFCLVILCGVGWLVWSRAGRDGIKSTATGDGSLRITITEAKANELLSAMLPSDFSVTDPSVRFTDEGLFFSGTANPSQFIDANVEFAYPELAAIKRLLPNRVSFEAHFTVTNKGGKPNIVPKALELEQYSIPLGLLPRSVQTTISDLILSQIDRTGFTLTELHISAGKLTIGVQ